MLLFGELKMKMKFDDKGRFQRENIKVNKLKTSLNSINFPLSTLHLDFTT